MANDAQDHRHSALIRGVHSLTRALSGRGTFTETTEHLAQWVGASALVLARLDLRRTSVAMIGTSADTVHIEWDAIGPLTKGETGVVVRLPTRGAEMQGFVLDTGAAFVDVVVALGGAQEALSDLARDLPMVWALRKAGLITAMVDPVAETRAILSPRNPFGLTRAELGVCHQLLDGLGAQAIAEKLDVSMPTVRTHLRNIYAKTGLDGMVAVVHKLHTDNIG